MHSLPQTALQFAVKGPPRERQSLGDRGWGLQDLSQGGGSPRAAGSPGRGLVQGGCCLSVVAELKAAVGTGPASFGISKAPVGPSAGGEDPESGCIICHGRGLLRP